MKMLMTALMALGFAGQVKAAPHDVAELLQGYRDISTALAYDHLNETKDLAKKLVPVIDAWLAATPAGPLHPPVKKLREGATLVMNGADEGELREKMVTLAQGALGILKISPSLQSRWQLYYCPMVKAYWPQPVADPMANPYMGTHMLTCGVKKKWSQLP